MEEDPPALTPAPPMNVPLDGTRLELQEALELLRQSPGRTLSFVHPETGEILGVLSRPVPTPPRLGGMATPLGVYLTDGVHSGGAGFWGLFLTGVTLGALALAAQAGVLGLGHVLSRTAPAVGAAWEGSGLASALATLGLLFVGLRLLPMSGTHAAEHQVVHCVERGAPLMPSCVRTMPRVHPRCGTNLVVGFTLLQLTFLGVFSGLRALSWSTMDAATLSLMLAAPVALIFWRRLGGWVQQWLATRPATDSQIAGAIHAAQQVLQRRAASEESSAVRFRFLRRLWRMGLAQVVLGYGVLVGLLTLLASFWPALGNALGV